MADGSAPAPWVILLNWNGRDDTLECLTGLRSHCRQAHIVVVDNGSVDDSVQAIATLFPDIEILQTGANLGYAGGNNRGISYALSHGAELVAVLNNDTLIANNFLDPLVRHITDNPRIIVSPDIRYAADPGVSWFRGGLVEWSSAWPRHLTPDEQEVDSDDPADSEVLTGCCVLATADAWREIGLFDERFFLLFEDSDWCMRAARLGFRLQVLPASRIEHKVSRSFVGSAATLGTFYFARNGLLFSGLYHRGTRLLTQLRFLWQWLGYPTLREIRRREPGLRWAVIMRLLAVWCYATARLGVAPPLAVRIAERSAAARLRG